MHSDDQAVIAHLKLQIEKLNRDRYGPRSGRICEGRTLSAASAGCGAGSKQRSP
jgi:hypothetical protein